MRPCSWNCPRIVPRIQESGRRGSGQGASTGVIKAKERALEAVASHLQAIRQARTAWRPSLAGSQRQPVPRRDFGAKTECTETPWSRQGGEDEHHRQRAQALLQLSAMTMPVGTRSHDPPVWLCASPEKSLMRIMLKSHVSSFAFCAGTAVNVWYVATDSATSIVQQ